MLEMKGYIPNKINYIISTSGNEEKVHFNRSVLLLIEEEEETYEVKTIPRSN